MRVRLPRRRRFVGLETLREIPVGSLVDTTRGRVLLSSVSRRGGVQQGRFFDGLFLVRQRRTDRYLTELLLRGDYGPCRARRALSARAKRRRLWGMQGAASGHAGAIRPAPCAGRWLVEDRCAGPSVVRRGRVAVRDFGRGTTTLVEAGERYLAQPR